MWCFSMADRFVSGFVKRSFSSCVPDSSPPVASHFVHTKVRTSMRQAKSKMDTTVRKASYNVLKYFRSSLIAADSPDVRSHVFEK